jgi:hypothetical protein
VVLVLSNTKEFESASAGAEVEVVLVLGNTEVEKAPGRLLQRFEKAHLRARRSGVPGKFKA